MLWLNQRVLGSLSSISLAVLDRGASGLGNRGAEGQSRSSLCPGEADLREPECWCDLAWGPECLDRLGLRDVIVPPLGPLVRLGEVEAVVCESRPEKVELCGLASEGVCGPRHCALQVPHLSREEFRSRETISDLGDQGTKAILATWLFWVPCGASGLKALLQPLHQGTLDPSCPVSPGHRPT